jgi:hypothetical protein
MFCPLKKGDESERKCDGKKCGWWHGWSGECAVLIIARRVGDSK